MSRDPHPRRRLPGGGPRRSRPRSPVGPWVYTILAALAVIAGGWFLGQGLAHWLSPSSQMAQAPTPAPPVTALPSATPASSPTAIPSPTAPPSPIAGPTVKPHATVRPRAIVATPTNTPASSPTATATAVPTRVPTATPAATPTIAPTPIAITQHRSFLPVARRSEETSPAVAAGDEAASATVRSYIDALRRGDPQAAAALLGNGAPDEDFIDATTRITNVSSTRNSDGSYKVGVDMQTSKGEYYETFIVAQTGTGTRILDKNAIRP